MPATPEPPKLVKELSRKEIAFALARVPGTSRLFFGGSDFQVYDVDLAVEKPEPKALGGHESYVTGLALTAGKKLVSGGYDGKLIWWDAEGGAKVRAVDAHSKRIRAVEASPDGLTIASVADDMACRLWDAETGSTRAELRGHQAMTPSHFGSMLYACAFSPDGKFLATGDRVGHIVVWDLATNQAAATMEAPGLYTWDGVQRLRSIGGVRALAFAPDGNALAAGGISTVGNVDGLEAPARVEVFDWRKSAKTHEMNVDGTKAIVERLIFHPDGDRLLAVGGANDGLLVVFDLKAKAVAVQQKPPMHIYDAALGDTPETFVAVGFGKVAAYEWKG